MKFLPTNSRAFLLSLMELLQNLKKLVWVRMIDTQCLFM
jgi:hypothetical protein